jgi:hypothetical protein
MEVELKTEHFLTCGITINLDLYAIPALSLNFSASTYNCVTNHLKIVLSLCRKKCIRLRVKLHKPGNDNLKRLRYIAVLRRVPYFSSIQSEQIASKNNTKYKNVRISND